MSESARLELSVVVPFLNERDVLPILRRRLSGLDALPAASEFVFVSDGSDDGSVELVEEWAASDPRVKLVVLSRNFGHQAAVTAGLDHALGAFVGVIDADLQDDPEALLEMHREARDGGFDVVYGVRSSREGVGAKRLGYRAFYALYSALADTPVVAESGDFCVLSRRAVEALRALPERVRFVRGLRSWIGLRAKAHRVHRPARAAGAPQYSLTKLVGLALDGLTSFSTRPLRVATVLGVALFVSGLLLSLGYVVLFFRDGLHTRAPGFTTLAVLVLCLSGAQFVMLGIVGEYIAQIFLEVKGRPTYLVERRVNLPPSRP